MDNRTLLLLGLLAAGAYYLSTRRPALAYSGAGLAPGTFPTYGGSGAAAPYGTLPTSEAGRTGAILAALGGTAATVLPAVLGGAGAAGAGAGVAAGGAGAAGAGAGIGLAAAMTAAGIAAGAAILAWGIIQKGWLRGGEEALKVNPARDAYFNHFIQAYFPGAGSDRQFEALQRATIDAGVRGDEAERLIAAIYAADTVREWEAAANAMTARLEQGVAVAAAVA